jgi:hypothetical protein
MECGNSFPSCVMEFDHVRGDKVIGVGLLAGYGVSIEAIQEEIAKCDLVCANCHRIRTWKRGQWTAWREAA